MGNVLSRLSDGSSWFTVVFAGVLLSVLAGALKEQVERWLSSLSTAFAHRKRAREESRTQLIDALLADPRYFELARFRAMVACLVFGASSLLYCCGPMMLAMQPASFVRSSVVWDVIAPCLGLLSVAMAYSAARRVELINAATSALRQRHRLPKLP